MQNYVRWVQGHSADIRVTGYKLYSDMGQPGNLDLIYDGSQNTEILTFVHRGLTVGTHYYYALEVLNFNGPSDKSVLAERPACDLPS